MTTHKQFRLLLFYPLIKNKKYYFYINNTPAYIMENIKFMRLWENHQGYADVKTSNVECYIGVIRHISMEKFQNYFNKAFHAQKTPTKIDYSKYSYLFLSKGYKHCQ